MRIIPIEDALRILEEAYAVVVDDEALTFPAIDTDYECFMSLVWESEDHTFEYVCDKSKNLTVTIHGDELIFTARHAEDEGDEMCIGIKPLFKKQIE